MKQFVFGLGNPGEKYAHTRHNAGLMTLERLVKNKTHQDFSQVAQKNAKLYASYYRSGDIFYAMPQTYMNDSGQAVRAMIEYFDKPLSADIADGKPAGTAEKPAIIIFYDDLDITVGQAKIQFGKGPKVHNGITSVRQHLNSDLFLHVRIGVDGRGGLRSQPGSDYVLAPFLSEERQVLEECLENVCQKVQELLETV